MQAMYDRVPQVYLEAMVRQAHHERNTPSRMTMNTLGVDPVQRHEGTASYAKTPDSPT